MVKKKKRFKIFRYEGNYYIHDNLAEISHGGFRTKENAERLLKRIEKSIKRRKKRRKLKRIGV